jgi:hypothetical protein
MVVEPYAVFQGVEGSLLGLEGSVILLY